MWRLAYFISMVPVTLVAARSQGYDGSFTSGIRLLTDEATSIDEHSRRESKKSDQQPRQFKLLTSKQIHRQLLEWKAAYPDLCHVTTSQAAYGLPAAGASSDCPFDSGPGCKNYIMTIQDFIAHPEGSDSSNRLPEVFLSGLLHGNERVGPTAVMEAASLILEAAQCESMPRVSKKPTSNPQDSSIGSLGAAWELELSQAKKCRDDLQSRGVNDEHRRWLARLATTRRLVIVPTSNALGYYRDERTENGIDPNRDFPYDVTNSKLCMQTIAGRTLNEVFREHMFQLSLTFHGGMEVVAYEWGAPTYLKHCSPDDEAQSQIAEAYSRYGGGWSGTRAYDVGTMNDMVYYVRGGFEDWAYAGSWDPPRVIPCTPPTFNGYDTSKTIYNNSTLRVFNMLVETSDNKSPPKSSLGTALDVLDADTTGNGHVSRNIRLALLAADMVEPYVSVLGTENLFLTDDVIPLTERRDSTCQQMKTIMIPKSTKETIIYWTVGGGMTIDDTSVWYGKWDDLPRKESIGCLLQPNTEEVQNSFQQGIPVGSQNGTGFFSENGAHPSLMNKKMTNEPKMGPVFSARIDTSRFKPMDQIAVVAVARVDQSWRNQPDNMSPIIPPQSHVVNARTNPAWRHESAGKIVEGRLDWYSIPLTIVIGDYTETTEIQSGRKVGVVEVSNRFSADADSISLYKKPKGAPPDVHTGLDWKYITGVVILVTLAIVTGIVLFRRRQRFRHQLLVDELYEEEGHFEGVKPYTDKVEDENDVAQNDNGDLELMEYA